jgi:hypothetical protein
VVASSDADDRRMTPHHRPAAMVALVAGVSLSLWLVVSAGVRTATMQPMRIPQPFGSATYQALPAAPMPSPGPDLGTGVR